jgi:hypothetical protein
MVRLGPSATNSQPWRIIKTKTSYDFYGAKSAYTNRRGQKISITFNDIGIAKAHFEYSAKEIGLYGNWIVKKDGISSNGSFVYVCSWQFEK